MKNPFVLITAIAFLVQTIMFVLFYTLPDPLGLSLTEMFSGKSIWQFFMTYGAILVLISLFYFVKKPRALVVFLFFYFFLAVADYEVFRFTHQRLSYSFLRTYFHVSNITDETTISTLGGDLKGTILWISVLVFWLLFGIFFFIFYSKKKTFFKNFRYNFKLPALFFSVGLLLSVIPLILFLSGTRGIKHIPVLDIPVDMRFTLGKHTLTAPVLHIAAVETFEFLRDDYELTDERLTGLKQFLPADFRTEKDYPLYRNAFTKGKAQKPYNIVFIFGESFKGRIFNEMLNGDSLLAPHLYALAQGKYFKTGGGGLWFKNAFSGGYPTVRGTMATYLGFPSHPNRDVPSFYASNHFKGFPEYLKEYHKVYMTVSNPVFDHTLPFVEKFFGKNYYMPDASDVSGIQDSLGVNKVLEILSDLSEDKPYFLAFNTISSHIPFKNYPDSFAAKPEDAMVRYRNAVRYTDSQLKKIFDALADRKDFERTVIIILGDHDTPVDSVDYKVPQPLGVSCARIFMGMFSPDSALFNGLTVREDVASQLDIAPTILDLTLTEGKNHFWGYDLLVSERPKEQPAVFFSQNAYFLGFRDSVLTGGLETEEIYTGKNDVYTLTTDSDALFWKKNAVLASEALRSVLRNDAMIPKE